MFLSTIVSVNLGEGDDDNGDERGGGDDDKVLLLLVSGWGLVVFTMEAEDDGESQVHNPKKRQKITANTNTKNNGTLNPK